VPKILRQMPGAGRCKKHGMSKPPLSNIKLIPGNQLTEPPEFPSGVWAIELQAFPVDPGFHHIARAIGHMAIGPNWTQLPPASASCSTRSAIDDQHPGSGGFVLQSDFFFADTWASDSSHQFSPSAGPRPGCATCNTEFVLLFRGDGPAVKYASMEQRCPCPLQLKLQFLVGRLQFGRSLLTCTASVLQRISLRCAGSRREKQVARLAIRVRVA
jgi:hypothetical protein